MRRGSADAKLARASCYERGSIILTSNLTFGSCDQAFAGEAVLTAAMLNRVLHYATVVTIRARAIGLRTKGRADLAEGCEAYLLSRKSVGCPFGRSRRYSHSLERVRLNPARSLRL
jgi:hypothetical protein